MKNSVIAQINYSFKGENFSPSIALDIEQFARRNDNFSSLYPKIAQANKIDTYSYAYEVMESSPILFHSPKGNIIDFIHDGKCDLLAYRNFLEQDDMYRQLEKIAAEILGINNLHAKENSKIKAALIQTYHINRNRTN